MATNGRNLEKRKNAFKVGRDSASGGLDHLNL
jgi:hypothetical protein